MGFLHPAVHKWSTTASVLSTSRWIDPGSSISFYAKESQISHGSTSLYAKPILGDFSQEAVSFFTSIRVPAALIAGSSFGALFVMTQKSTRSEKECAKTFVVVMFLYRALSLLSLLLSLNVIVTSTAASNSMLIANCNPVAESAYEVLIREMKFEYLTTKWSFYASILCFLKAVLFRILLEFDLLRKDRRRPAVLVLCSVTTLCSHILHIVNDCLYSYPNFYQMTLGVIRLYFGRVWNQKNPMLLLSFFSGFATLATLVSTTPKAEEYVRQEVLEISNNDS